MAAVCIAMALSSPLSRQIRELYGNSQHAAIMVCMAMLGCGIVSGITLLSIWRMLKRTEKMSALQALFDISENRKKKRAIKWYLPALLIAAAGAMLMVVPLNIHSTISSPVFVTYMGIGSSDIRIDAYKLSEKLESDESVSGFVRLDTVSIKALTAGNEEINLLAEYGNHSYFPVSYSEGNAPNGSNQVALSLLNAKELGLSVGDEIRIIRDGKAIPYAVCGIYSDITNGGKTAKIYDPALSSNGSERVMWSIFYVSLTDGQNRESWMAEYQTFGEKTFRVSDIAFYVASTFGQTISQIRLAAALSVISSSIILFVVLLLFTRLYVQSDRKDISLKKALGFRWKAVAKAYIGKYAFSVLAGIAVGEALGFLLGESLTGLLLKKLGADAFRFIPDWHSVLVKVPLLVFAVCAAAVCCGIHEVKRIRPEECVTGRE
jgi:putative ABC transport system permease protein